MTMHIWMVVTPNVVLLDYVGVAEIMRIARELEADFVLHTCSPCEQVSTSVGTVLAGLEPLPRTLPPNSLVLTIGVVNEDRDFSRPEVQRVVHWLKTTLQPDTRLASVCSGALLLARAGLLAGVRCTTHHSAVELLRAWEPRADVVTDRVFVHDERVLTSAGMTTGIDMALYIVEQFAGPELAARVARWGVIFQRRGPHDPQASPWVAHRNHMHPAVHKAQDAIAQSPERMWTLPELAEVAHVSPRHLSRLFAQYAGISVVAYQQQLRVARARDILTAQPHMSLERVAEASGFGSTRDFRRVWQRHVPDLAPTELRRAS